MDPPPHVQQTLEALNVSRLCWLQEAALVSESYHVQSWPLASDPSMLVQRPVKARAAWVDVRPELLI